MASYALPGRRRCLPRRYLEIAHLPLPASGDFEPLGESLSRTVLGATEAEWDGKSGSGRLQLDRVGNQGAHGLSVAR